ncbi:hypothetical protein BESB_027530 [Besnoitia besnoiti]|uniref:Myosin heavy chain n=1 Tax=Besnoitia besnoiti TaxID=94643 RepID=A0A2A9LXW2_BESBE|nr:uncharacterized protein BESB_027530 [Besnoitia besnoiti]PFH31318.1 hypothetical protein BESB_027530 [Besnoitia besnoiti]
MATRRLATWQHAGLSFVLLLCFSRALSSGGAPTSSSALCATAEDSCPSPAAMISPRSSALRRATRREGLRLPSVSSPSGLFWIAQLGFVGAVAASAPRGGSLPRGSTGSAADGEAGGSGGRRAGGRLGPSLPVSAGRWKLSAAGVLPLLLLVAALLYLFSRRVLQEERQRRADVGWESLSQPRHGLLRGRRLASAGGRGEVDGGPQGARRLIIRSLCDSQTAQQISSCPPSPRPSSPSFPPSPPSVAPAQGPFSALSAVGECSRRERAAANPCSALTQGSAMELEANFDAIVRLSLLRSMMHQRRARLAAEELTRAKASGEGEQTSDALEALENEVMLEQLAILQRAHLPARRRVHDLERGAVTRQTLKAEAVKRPQGASRRAAVMEASREVEGQDFAVAAAEDRLAAARSRQARAEETAARGGGGASGLSRDLVAALENEILLRQRALRSSVVRREALRADLVSDAELEAEKSVMRKLRMHVRPVAQSVAALTLARLRAEPGVADWRPAEKAETAARGSGALASREEQRAQDLRLLEKKAERVLEDAAKERVRLRVAASRERAFRSQQQARGDGRGPEGEGQERKPDQILEDAQGRLQDFLQLSASRYAVLKLQWRELVGVKAAVLIKELLEQDAAGEAGSEDEGGGETEGKTAPSTTSPFRRRHTRGHSKAKRRVGRGLRQKNANGLRALVVATGKKGQKR